MMPRNRSRLLWILPLAAALVWFLSESAVKGPMLMILLGLPLVLGLVPKNWLYGLRTPRTLRSSDEVWYIQNRITGVAMVAGGLVWLAVLAVR
ncbi:MAG: SdpI family protein [Vicinamibacterales bacterium]